MTTAPATRPRVRSRASTCSASASSAIDPDDALGEVTRWIDNGDQHYVCVTGVHGVMESQGDAELLRIHNESGLTTPDGMPMVWAARFAGRQEHRARLRTRPHARGLRARRRNAAGAASSTAATDEVLDQLRAQPVATASRASRSSARTRRRSGPLTPEEDDAVVQRDQRVGRPDRVGRAQHAQAGTLDGEPRRSAERSRALRCRCRVRHPRRHAAAGTALDAAIGLEWLFRLASEPRRLWRRYAVNNPRFVLAISRRRPRISIAAVVLREGHSPLGTRG